METPNFSPLTPKQDRRIGGWLSFFLFVVGMGAALTVIFTFYNFSFADYDMGGGDFITYLWAALDILFTLGIGGLAGYTIWAFLKKRPNAVFLGKSYVIIIFLSNSLILLSGEYEESGLGSLSQIVKALAWGIIWFTYLCVSEQVLDLFPKEGRKIPERDKYIVGSLVAIPLLLIGMVLLISLGSRVPSIDTSSLSADESTDGKIIFRMPDKLLCEKIDTLDNVYHSFAQGDSIWGTIVGVYDTNSSEEYFKECVDSWRDPYLDGYDFSVINTSSGVINRNIMRTQIVRYITQPEILWTFATLFSPETGKACIVSLYTTTRGIESGEALKKLLNSVRFK